MTKIVKAEVLGQVASIDFEDGTQLRVVGNQAEWATAEKVEEESMDVIPDDFFDMRFDADHFYNFFEDENADACWAGGNLSDEEFVRQVNEYDDLCGGSGWDPYKVEDITHTFGRLRSRNGDDYVQRVIASARFASPIKVIYR